MRQLINTACVGAVAVLSLTALSSRIVDAGLNDKVLPAPLYEKPNLSGSIDSQTPAFLGSPVIEQESEPEAQKQQAEQANEVEGSGDGLPGFVVLLLFLVLVGAGVGVAVKYNKSR